MTTLGRRIVNSATVTGRRAHVGGGEKHCRRSHANRASFSRGSCSDSGLRGTTATALSQVDRAFHGRVTFAGWAGQHVKVLAGGAVGVDRSAAWSSVERGTVTSLRVSGSTAGGMQPQGSRIREVHGLLPSELIFPFVRRIEFASKLSTCTSKIDSSPTRKMCVYFLVDLLLATN
jgi:hypothetical protein